MTAKDPSGGPRYRIGAVAKATGIAPDTLRVWERRYGGLTPERSDAGGRLYAPADITRLRLIKELLDRGHAIGTIASLSDVELRQMLAHGAEGSAPEGTGAAAVREEFVAAIGAFDVEAAQRILARAGLGLPAVILASEIIAPILDEVGRRWADGRLRVAQEHNASSLLRSLVGGLLATYPRSKGAPTMVLTTPTGELHEFGALLAALVAQSMGWNALYLGPNLPVDDMLHAVRRPRASALALSLVTTESPDVSADLDRLVRELPREIALLVGGSAVGRYPVLEARALTLPTLGALEDWLTRQPPRAP
jgi:DNA-binding transcriptional MerR regulator